MENEPNAPKVGIGVYIFKDGKLLVGKRKGSHGAGEVQTPGGHLEPLETFEACARREVREETGLEIGNIRFLRLMNLRAYAPKHYADIALVADWVSGVPQVLEPDRIESWEWCDPSCVPTPLFATMASALEALRTGQRYFDGAEEAEAPARKKGPLKIYFSAPLRGGANYDLIRARVGFLGAFGEVLTKHMVSPATADLRASDAEIYAHDQKLLAESDVFIADLSNPSTGAGFMAGRAAALGKPTLCLFREGMTPSAMITGCPEIVTRAYADDKGFQQAVRSFLLGRSDLIVPASARPVRIGVLGPPGSGKGTLASRLAAECGAVHVSTGALLRDVITREEGPRSAVIKAHMDAGELVPAALMREIVAERLERTDCRFSGYVLDGYPPSRDDQEGLHARGLLPDVVFLLECSDETAIARQTGRNERATDQPDQARHRVELFRQETPDAETLSTEWFAEGIVIRLDAEMPPAMVLYRARKAIARLYGSPEYRSSTVPIAECRSDELRTTRVHVHVDALDARRLRDIALRVYATCQRAQGQLTIYPVQHLQLGPQVAQMPSVYGALPNFHPIYGATDEAFLTGRLGDGDLPLAFAVITEALKQGAMTEVEEVLGEWTLKPNGSVVTEVEYRPTGLTRDVFQAFLPWRIGSVPPIELHLGFDITKSPMRPMPISLEALMRDCAAADFRTGGWFIFADDGRWKYRSNEFAFGEMQDARNRLVFQAIRLQEILVSHGIDVDVSFSLELVHGIWTGARR